MTKHEFESLLSEGESAHLDWKRDLPTELIGPRGPNWDSGRAKFLKDLVALANGHDAERAFLVYGVEDNGANRRVCGVSRSIDDAQVQQWAEHTFEPPPSFRLDHLSWDGSTVVTIVTIARVPDYPHVAITNLGGVLAEGQVWFRRGSKNTVALRDDLRRMILGETPFKIARTNDPVLADIGRHYEALGRQTSLPASANKDSCLARGYELAFYPGTRREVWVGAVGDHYDHVLMLKPKV